MDVIICVLKCKKKFFSLFFLGILSMAKKGKVEVEGYLHYVSDLHETRQKKKYFTALLQEAERNCRVVVFDPQRHNSFQSAEKDRYV